MKNTIKYSDGYIKNDELINYALSESTLCYIDNNAICRMPNTKENRIKMDNIFINEYFFPHLGNCEYSSKLRELIQKYLIDDATYNVRLHVRFQYRVKSPYVESTVPHLCLGISSEERILNTMIGLRSKGIADKYILDLLNAE